MLFKKKLRFTKPADGTIYIVRANNYAGGEYLATYQTRAQARAYKKLLRESDQNIQAEIFKQTFSGGYEFTPEKVS